MPVRSRHKEDRIQVLDGGTGSELRRRGVSLTESCWSAEANISDEDLLCEIHRDYIHAGADIITANTFASTRFVLAGAGLEPRFEEINESAFRAAHKAADSCDRDIIIAGSLSCFLPALDGSAYPSLTAEYRCYAELCASFIENGIDLILVEMMQDTVHAALACRAACESDLPFWIGVSCRLDAQTGNLVAFDNPETGFADVLDTILPFNPQGISIMHTPVDAIGPALVELGTHWAGPVGAYAEIPYPEDPGARPGRLLSPRDYADFAQSWLELGAVMLGGCCGTTPEHIAALKNIVDDR